MYKWKCTMYCTLKWMKSSWCRNDSHVGMRYANYPSFHIVQWQSLSLAWNDDNDDDESLVWQESDEIWVDATICVWNRSRNVFSIACRCFYRVLKTKQGPLKMHAVRFYFAYSSWSDYPCFVRETPKYRSICY